MEKGESTFSRGSHRAADDANLDIMILGRSLLTYAKAGLMTLSSGRDEKLKDGGRSSG